MSKDYNRFRYCSECGEIVADVTVKGISFRDNCLTRNGRYICKNCEASKQRQNKRKKAVNS